MAVNVTEDSNATGDARDKPGASNRRVGTGDEHAGGVGSVGGGAVRCGGDRPWLWWWVGGGERENEAVFCKMSPLRTQPPFSAQC